MCKNCGIKLSKDCGKKLGNNCAKNFVKKNLGKKGNCEKNWRKKVTILCR